MIPDLKYPLLKSVPLQQFGGLLSALQHSSFHDLTLVRYGHATTQETNRWKYGKSVKSTSVTFFIFGGHLIVMEIIQASHKLTGEDVDSLSFRGLLHH